MTVRRLKTYTAETGLVYQYYFVGSRPALPDDPFAPAVEFIFDVSSDRKQTFAVSIFLLDKAVFEWEGKHGRDLADVEHFAASKMMLLRAFDSFDNMMKRGRRLLIGTEELEQLLAQLGLD